jgi:AraC-like DNA-binding protein
MYYAMILVTYHPILKELENRMIHIKSVHWDDYNPNWRNHLVHVQYPILVLATNGKIRYQLNGDCLILKRAELLYIPAGTMRSSENDTDVLHQKYAVIFQPNETIQEQLPFLDNNRNQIIPSNSFEYVKQRFASLYQHWVERQPYYEILTTGIFLEILSHVQREASTKHISPIKIKIAHYLKDYLIKHYRTSIKIDDLAKLVDRSPNYVISLFKELTGQTPLEYMLHLRISKAHELLLQTRMTNGEIAEYLGFYDSSYFFRIFKRVMGYPPSSIRNPAPKDVH